LKFSICRKSKKRKKEKDEAGSSKKAKVVVDEDAVKHGGWWAAKTAADITGTVSIEFGDRSYLRPWTMGNSEKDLPIGTLIIPGVR